MRRALMGAAASLLLVTGGVIGLLLGSGATSSWASPPDVVGAGVPSDETVAARVGNRVITVRDLDTHWRRDSPAEQAGALQALYDGRKGALVRAISDALIEHAARAVEMPVDAFTEAEIARRVQPVSDEDVLAFYAENRTELGGAPIDELRSAIRAGLERQQRERARAVLVEELAKSGPPVSVLLDAPRLQVPVDDDDPAFGSDAAPVSIVVFSDFQCPFCARVAPTLDRVREVYGSAVRVVWKDFPLTSIHPHAFTAAEASHCAAAQDGYWPYTARLFENQQAQAVPDLIRYAGELGLDRAKFAACLDSTIYRVRVRAGLEAGARLGVSATPTLFVNGRVVHGAQPFDTLAEVIDDELDRSRRSGALSSSRPTLGR